MFGRLGCQGQRFERSHQLIAAGVRTGRVREPDRLIDGRRQRLAMCVGCRAHVRAPSFQCGDLQAPQLRARALSTIERGARVPVDLVDGPRHDGRLLLLLDALSVFAFQLARQSRSRRDEFLERLAVQVVDLLVETGH